MHRTKSPDINTTSYTESRPVHNGLCDVENGSPEPVRSTLRVTSLTWPGAPPPSLQSSRVYQAVYNPLFGFIVW
jgi:hypothetical protein